VSHKKAQNLLWFLLALCIAFTLVSEVSAQDSLALKQSRGRQIYRQGTSQSGKEILAYIGDASVEVPASSMACAGCHGLDGRGKPEGGVNPSNVTWESLTKPYGAKNPDGRQHPPYTERALELAVTRGVDPGGNKLLQAMPRYTMSREDLADLTSYLQVLGKDSEPGVSEDKIVIGTLTPASGSLVELGRSIMSVTKAVFDETNSQGGIYGRRVELQVIEGADNAAATRGKLEPLLKNQQMFAMSGAILAGAEKEIIPLLSQNETPLVAPFTLYPQLGFPLNRQVFYLLSGLDGQARSLLNFIAQKPEFKKSNLAVIAPRTDFYAGVIDAVKEQQKKNGSNAPVVVQYEPGHFDVADAIKQSRQSAAEIVLFASSGDDALSFMREAEKLNWFPVVLVPGGGVGAAVFGAPAGFDRKVFFSFATSPADHSQEGLQEFHALATKYKLPSTHIAAQVSAFAAAKMLVEALKRVGKDLTREKLIEALEEFHGYSTGLTPPITYGPNRRIGAMGAYIVAIDLKEKTFVPVSGWVDSN